MQPSAEHQVEFLTIAEVAFMLRVSERTVGRLIDGGKLAAVNITGCGCRRILRESAEHYRAEAEKQAREAWRTGEPSPA